MFITMRLKDDLANDLLVAAGQRGLEYKSMSGLVSLIVRDWINTVLKVETEIPNCLDPKAELKLKAKENARQDKEPKFNSFEEWQRAEQQLREGEQRDDKVERRTEPR